MFYKSLLAFLESAKYCGDLPNLKSLMQNMVENQGFSCWACASLSEHGGRLRDVVHTYPADWVSRYLENGYASVDPVVLTGRRRVAPFRWRPLLTANGLTDNQKAYVKEAEQFDLEDGIGIPVVGAERRMGLFTIAASGTLPSINTLLRYHGQSMLLMAYAFQMLSDQIGLPEANGRKESALTSRERECLLWSAHGKSSWEIGQIINVSERTVVFHIENAKRKMGVTSRSQAIVKAIGAGYIDPS